MEKRKRYAVIQFVATGVPCGIIAFGSGLRWPGWAAALMTWAVILTGVGTRYAVEHELVPTPGGESR